MKPMKERGYMSKESELKYLRHTLGWSVSQAANYLGISERRYRRAEKAESTGAFPAPPDIKRKMREAATGLADY